MLKRWRKNSVIVFVNWNVGVWGAGAIISAAITIIGLAMAADAKEVNYGSNGSTQQEILLQLSSD